MAVLADLPAGKAHAEQGVSVDLELLLALDVSHSVTVDEHAAQINGLAAAFRHERLISAIRNLPTGRAAVAVMFWAGPENQIIAVPWTLVDSTESANSLADSIARETEPPWDGLSFTAIGTALLRGADEIDSNGYDGRRRIIDLSGDDPSNQGVKAAEARDLVVLRGIVINGLPILQDRKEHEDREALVRYFETEVAGGVGAFVLPTLSFNDFPRAMLAKLITEVSGRTPSVSPLRMLAGMPAD
ncbi:MAG: DUF1194 domain-containing protein [Minwuia sp.]|nr:DUF1194 domain-containing protein [Minwuia sp.]